MERGFWEVVAELTAAAGIDPWRWSVRELLAASQWRRMDAWQRMAVGTSWVCNSQGTLKRVIHPADINPLLHNQAGTDPDLVKHKLRAWARRNGTR